MTTTNNHLTLIEKVGGIEKAREIVEGAPEWASSYCKDSSEYYSVHDDFECCYNLNNLRTAIDMYDGEFKAGDLVVLRSLDLLCVTDLIELVEFDGEHWKTNNRIGRCNPKGIRHATPSEIKAGRRLDHSEDVTDMVTDIRNHISPRTVVWDLASGEDWGVNHG